MRLAGLVIVLAIVATHWPPAGAELGDAGAQPQLDTGRAQRVLDHRAGVGPELGADRLGAFDQDDARLGGRLRAAVGGDPGAEFGGKLDACEAAADDGEGVTAGRGGLGQHGLQTIVEGDSVGIGVDAPAVLGDAGQVLVEATDTDARRCVAQEKRVWSKRRR